MRLFRFSWFLLLVALLGFAAVAYAFVSESRTFRTAVLDWASRDLTARTELAASALSESLSSGDFRQLRALGEDCRARGVRLTVLSQPGGMIFDTLSTAHGDHATRPEVISARAQGMGIALRRSATDGVYYLYCARRTAQGFIRLAVPRDRVFAPADQSRIPTFLAGLAGVCAFLVVFLFVGILVAHNHALARERADQERRLAELKRAEDFRRSFVSDVTHEIKTPLTGILTAVDLLQDTATPADERQTLLDLLRKESVRLNNLVRDVLSLARLEQGPEELPHTFVQTDLAGVVAETLARLEPKAGPTQLRVAPDSLSSLPCFCDAGLVGQALANLIENALRYSGSPDVVVTLKQEDALACIVVEDHGVGIAPEYRARIFERFYRVDKARSRAFGGTGLGLAIVKHIAQVHGGTVTLAEGPDGKGCRFTFTLLLQQKDNTRKDANT